MEKIGFTPFRVEKKTKYLDVTVTADRKRYRPGDKVQVDLAVQRRHGAGHRSELTVMVVDEAVLALTGYRPPDLVRIVYADRGLSARVNDNRPFLISKADLLQKGQGYGGGVEEGPRVRRRFLKLAHYEPALVTDEGGRAEVYVVSFPDLGRRLQVSVNGGDKPRWSADGNELFFWTPPPDRALMASRVSTANRFSREPAQPLFSVAELGVDTELADYDVAPDGQSFFLSVKNPEVRAKEIHVVVNWLERLKRAAPSE